VNQRRSVILALVTLLLASVVLIGCSANNPVGTWAGDKAGFGVVTFYEDGTFMRGGGGSQVLNGTYAVSSYHDEPVVVTTDGLGRHFVFTFGPDGNLMLDNRPFQRVSLQRVSQ